MTTSDPLPAGPRRRRVLVVDDSPDSLESTSLLLSMMGHIVETAIDGVQAVHRAETFRPEVILMDVGLPKLDGYGATRRIRSEPWGREMTIIAVTGWGQENDRARSKTAGCDAHLIKPIEIAEFEAILAATTPASRPDA